MIPLFNGSMVLPPFTGDTPIRSSSMSPYITSMLEFVERFSTSHERLAILKGFIAYRKDLRNIGISDGFQWIDGSFIEDVESLRKRPPADIDLVTFATIPLEDKKHGLKIILIFLTLNKPRKFIVAMLTL